MAAGSPRQSAVTEVKVVGLRRRIAEKMALSKSRIPHITIVEEVNVSPLEDLRATLNKKPTPERPKLTLLPFLMRAMVKALAEQPALNALYDDDAGIVRQHAAINIGIATQTPTGLIVPVVKHAEARDLWGCGIELGPPRRARPRRHRDARRTDRLDHHHHVARRARRHRDDAGDQLSGSRHRRRQQDGRAPGLGRYHLRAAAR